MQYKWLIAGLILWTTMMGCKDKSSVDDSMDVVTVEIPEDFLTFYNQFHTDTLFQVEHINFPLAGLPSLDPQEDISGTTFWWERDGWKYHRPFNDMDGTYSRTFTNFQDIITETIKDQSGQFTMVRRFTRSGDSWRLIFYKELGRNRMQ